MQSPSTKFKNGIGDSAGFFLLKSGLREKLHFLNCHCIKFCLGSKNQVAHSVLNEKDRMNTRKGFQTFTVNLWKHVLMPQQNHYH